MKEVDNLEILTEVQKTGTLSSNESILVNSGTEVANAINSLSEDITQEISTSNIEYAQRLLDSNQEIVDVLTELNTNLGGELSDLTAGLTDTMQSVSGLSTDQIVFSLVIVVVGALSAWLFNFLHWKVVRRTDKQTNIANALTSMLEELEPVALKYWLEDFVKEKEYSIEINEIKLKSILKLFANQVRLLNKITDKTVFQRSSGELLERYANDLFDIVTGGNFESHGRLRSKTTATKISNLCANAKMCNQRSKNQQKQRIKARTNSAAQTSAYQEIPTTNFLRPSQRFSKKSL